MTISVVIPTYHRPDQVRHAVTSVLAQELPAGEELEVVVALSDPGADADVATAEALAAGDARVKVARARRPGPAAARNAGVDASTGWAIAFIDDDCTPREGWLRAAVAALAGADLVQGRTVPDGPIPLWHHSINVNPPSWLWETCNLVVRRSAVDAYGRFDEDWNPLGVPGSHFGEDVIWGWTLVKAGARPAFARDAVVEHVVEPRDHRGQLAYKAKLRYFPLLFQRAPEARKHFYKGYFVNQRHVMLTATAALLGAAGVAALAGRRQTATIALGAATAAYLSPMRGRLWPALRWSAYDMYLRAPSEAVEFAASVYGSIRFRRLLL